MSVCAWLTGLSGAGKSVTAAAAARLLAASGHAVVLIDGDLLRHTSPVTLGFSRGDRDVNGMRAAAMAKAAVGRGELVVCALISPYRQTRSKARDLVGSDRFLEVFLDVPLSVCESRDPKGLYKRARAGLLPHFTGIDDPYESPLCADVVLTTCGVTIDDNARRLVDVMLTRAASLAIARADRRAVGR